MNNDDAVTARIRSLNDRFRAQGHQGGVPGRIFITPGIEALPAIEKALIVKRVRQFVAFSSANGPDHEHDYGSFEHVGARICWKIDYYANGKLEDGASDSSDPTKSFRVLTIMFANER